MLSLRSEFFSRHDIPREPQAALVVGRSVVHLHGQTRPLAHTHTHTLSHVVSRHELCAPAPPGAAAPAPCPNPPAPLPALPSNAVFFTLPPHASRTA